LCWSWRQELSHKEEAEEAVPAVDVVVLVAAAAMAVAHPQAWVWIADWAMLRSVLVDVRMMV
jgi:hypothetical protein